MPHVGGMTRGKVILVTWGKEWRSIQLREVSLPKSSGWWYEGLNPEGWRTSGRHTTKSTTLALWGDIQRSKPLGSLLPYVYKHFTVYFSFHNAATTAPFLHKLPNILETLHKNSLPCFLLKLKFDPLIWMQLCSLMITIYFPSPS